MEPHPLEAVYARYSQAWNDHDVDAILALHTDDSVFENHTSGGRGVGKDEIRAVLNDVFGTFPDLKFEARRLYVRDDLVAVEWTATASFAKPIKRGDRTLQPSGKTLEWHGSDIIPFKDGLVARKDVYADSISFLRQIGVEIL
jgi:steroid delta-isomerase-like uncharacterized protein